MCSIPSRVRVPSRWTTSISSSIRASNTKTNWKYESTFNNTRHIKTYRFPPPSLHPSLSTLPTRLLSSLPSTLHTIPHRTLFNLPFTPERVQHHEQKIVPYPSPFLFDVVLNVTDYHTFLPFCVDSCITSHTKQGERGTMYADLTVGFRVFTERYTSKITYERSKWIQIQAIESSVFGHLVSRWVFQSIPANDGAGEKCLVDFSVEFEVSSLIHASAIKLFFTDVAQRQLVAFSERCRIMMEQRKKDGILAGEKISQPSISKAAQIPSSTPPPISPPLPPPLPLPIPALSTLPRRHFTPTEVTKLRTVFAKYAQLQASPTLLPSSTSISPLDNSLYGPLQTPSLRELRLAMHQFHQLCGDTCMAHHGVLGRFRERAVLRAVVEDGIDGAVTCSIFADDPMVYERIKNGDATWKREMDSKTIGFGEMLDFLYFSTKATGVERFEHALIRCAQLHSTSDSSSPITEHTSLSLEFLHASTTAFFQLQLAIMHTLMPVMIYHRVRQSETGLTTDSSAEALHPPSDPSETLTERGLMVLGLTGLLENVVEEAERSMRAVNDGMVGELRREWAMGASLEPIKLAASNSNSSNSAPSTTTHSSSSTHAPTCTIRDWCARWQLEGELLSIISVPGMATLIQWASERTAKNEQEQQQNANASTPTR